MGTKWSLSYVSYVIHTTLHTGSPPHCPFSSLSSSSLWSPFCLSHFISFCCISLSMNCVFSLFLALPFQDRKGPITITKRRLSCAAYYSHYSNSQLVYPLHVHILFLLLFLLRLVECVAQGCVPRARSNNDRMLDQLIFFRFWFPVLLNPHFG